MKIHVGFEVGTGEEIYIEPAHMVVTGVTQLSGKTTTLNAIIERSRYRAVLFKTKPGEKAITSDNTIQPFYREEFDWEYASVLMEAHRKEKLKFERAWIIKYSKGARNIFEFKSNIDQALNKKLSKLEKNVLITLQAYLDKILPELEKINFSNTLSLTAGINVMDLENLNEETQNLIIMSVLDEVLRNHKKTFIVIPEAWRFIPEFIRTPVKSSAISFIRQGAANENYLLIDSQDMAGVSKSVLKQCSIWFLGYQSEINEIKRTLAQLPLPSSQKPTADQISTLPVGHFFLATPNYTKKIYVQPVWMTPDEAIKISIGEKEVSNVHSDVVPTIDEEKIIKKVVDNLSPRIEAMKNQILSEVLQEKKIYLLTPLDKIQKDFLLETKEHILSEISNLDDDQKKILNFLEVKGSGSNVSEILDRAYPGISVTNKSNRDRILSACRGLKYLNLIRMDSNNRIYPNLRERLEDRLKFYNATDDDVQLVYNHIISEIKCQK